MGFLDNSSITVDAILTKIGRKRISDGSFRVSKFSLSDEEIDYTLYDVTHPNGTDSYGTVIENMNLLEAQSNRTGFNSHLINQTIAGAKIKLASLNYPNLENSDNLELKPSTEGAPSENYSFVVENREALLVDRHVFATYGHNWTDQDVIRHDYFGTDRVIDDLKKIPSYHNGLVELTQDMFHRENDEVVKIE